MCQAECGFHPGCIAHNCLIELLTALDETLFRLVRRLQSAVKLLILVLEALHGLFTDHALEYGLEVLLELLILLLVQTHGKEGLFIGG